jgi:hypothetical protein
MNFVAIATARDGYFWDVGSNGHYGQSVRLYSFPRDFVGCQIVDPIVLSQHMSLRCPCVDAVDFGESEKPLKHISSNPFTFFKIYL